MFYPIHTANLNAIKAVGRSDLFLKLEIAKKVVGVIALLTTMKISVEAMAYSLLAVSVLSQIINSWPNKELLGYSYYEQLNDIIPTIGLAISMGVIVLQISRIGLSDAVTLTIQIMVGVIYYYFGAKIMHIESLQYLQSIIQNFRKKTA